jgi:hypothetical protein
MAPSTPLSLSTKVILTNPEDWEPWYTNLKAHVYRSIWPFIDPSQPERPLLEHPGVIPRIADINPAATFLHQLTPAQQRVYESSRKFYDSDMKYYNTQEDQLKEARIYITETISDMKHLHLNVDESVREWLVILKKCTEPTKGHLIQKAVSEYNTVFRVKPTGTRVGTWIGQWEHAMAKGVRYEIPQLLNGQWLRDLAAAIRPLSDSLYTKYLLQSDDPEQSLATEYIGIGRMLRQALVVAAAVRTTRGGAFAADFQGSEEDPANSPQSRMEGDRPPHSRKRARTESIKGETSSSKRSKSQTQCLACGIAGHALPDCWCIFADQMPEGYRIPKSRVNKR